MVSLVLAVCPIPSLYSVFIIACELCVDEQLLGDLCLEVEVMGIYTSVPRLLQVASTPIAAEAGVEF